MKMFINSAPAYFLLLKRFLMCQFREKLYIPYLLQSSLIPKQFKNKFDYLHILKNVHYVHVNTFLLNDSTIFKLSLVQTPAQLL